MNERMNERCESPMIWRTKLLSFMSWPHSIENRTDCIMTSDADWNRVTAKMSDEPSKVSPRWTRIVRGAEGSTSGQMWILPPASVEAGHSQICAFPVCHAAAVPKFSSLRGHSLLSRSEEPEQKFICKLKSLHRFPFIMKVGCPKANSL